MSNRYLYLRETTYQKEKDELLSCFFKNHIYIDYGLESTSFERMFMVVKAHDEVVLRTFSHLGTNNYSMLKNLNHLIKKGVLITSIDENINTEEPISWIMSITILIALFYKTIGFLSSERLLNKRNSGGHVGRKANKCMESDSSKTQINNNGNAKIKYKDKNSKEPDKYIITEFSSLSKTDEDI